MRGQTFAITLLLCLVGCTQQWFLASAASQSQVHLDPGVPLPDFEPDALYIKSTLHIDHLDAGTPETPRDACMIREKCLGGYGNRTVLRFGTAIWNRGPGDAILGGHPDDCEPERNPDYFEFDYCHSHWHFTSYADYRLLDGNRTVARGHKQGFCLEDSFCPPDREGKFNCEWQGISAGCGDLYYAGLACQWIDVTDVVSSPLFNTSKPLTLSVSINYDHKFPETNYKNNEAKVEFLYKNLAIRDTNEWNKPRHGPVPSKCAAARPDEVGI